MVLRKILRRNRGGLLEKILGGREKEKGRDRQTSRDGVWIRKNLIGERVDRKIEEVRESIYSFIFMKPDR